MKLDKWFIANVILLIIVIILDVLLTIVGIDLGFREGNFIIRKLILMLGLYLTLIIVGLLSIISSLLLIYVRQKTKKENHIRMFYFLLSLVISFRIFIIGIWFGMITVQLK